MKIRFLLAFLVGIACYACSDDDDIEIREYFEPLSADTLWYSQAEGLQSLGLDASSAVTAEVAEDAVEWCRAEVTGTGKGQALTVFCTPNEKVETRYTTLLLTLGQIQRKLQIYQYGVAPVIKVIEPNYTLSADSSELRVPVISNVEYEVLPAEAWIHPLGIVKGDNADTLRLGVSPSIYPNRSQEVLLKWNEVSASLRVTQISSDTIYNPAIAPDNRIKIKSGTANYASAALGFKYSWDGTPDSYVSGFIPLDKELVLTWNFEKAEQLGEMCYFPSESDPSRCLGVFRLFVQEEGTSEFKDLGEQDFKRKLFPSTLRFDSNLGKVTAVRIQLSAPEGAYLNWVFSCSEMYFYTAGFDPTSIFTDEICSGLKEGVTLEQIMSVKDEFYRNMARAMYLGTYEKEFRIHAYKPYMDPDVQGQEHKARKWSFLDNPTGILVTEGEEVVILADDSGDEPLFAKIMDWNADRRQINPEKDIIILRTGLNTFTADRTGLLYILYNTTAYKSRQPIKLHIPSGKVNGYFDIERHTNEDYQKLLQKTNYKFFEVQGKLTHLLFETEDFRSYCPKDIERVLEVTDSVTLLERQLSGLYKYNRVYPNRIFCKVAYDDDFSYWMYASDYHTGYQPASIPEILSPEKFRGNVWGFAHEHGHIYQNTDITWEGMTECSNNVFSLQVQTTFGYTSRLIVDDRYTTAYNDIAISGLTYNVSDVFSKLVPLWQLQLYFTKVVGQPDFYKDLYEELRLEPTPACPQMNLVELACRIGNTDLRDFFRFYKFLEPYSDGPRISQDQINEALEHIEAMTSLKKAPAIQYLRDDNVEMFRHIKPIEEGQAELEDDKLVLSGWKNVVAWEVYRNGNLAQISVKDNFTLVATGSGVSVKAVAADGTKVDVKLP